MEIVFKNKMYKSNNAKSGQSIPKQSRPEVKDTNKPILVADEIAGESGGESNQEEQKETKESSSSGRSEAEQGSGLGIGTVLDSDTYDDYHTSTINGIVLEYLELLGLEETYKSFWNECTKKMIPLPLGIREPLFRQTKFTHTEVEAFFQHYDRWEGEELSHYWSKFSEEVEDKGNSTLRRISILLRIYIASLPFRKGEDEAYKVNALDELREFHQAYSEEFTKDPICLPLFAFPFVADPTVHPAFKTMFTDEWQQDLRQQLQALFENHLQTHNTYGVSTCDLKQMYHHYIEESLRPPGSDYYDGDGESVQSKESFMAIDGNLNEQMGNETTTASVTQAPDIASAALSSDVCYFVKRSLIQTQDRYCKLLSATSAVVTALESAVQGKVQDIRILQSQLLKTFPELFSPVLAPAQANNSSGRQIVYKKQEIISTDSVVETVQQQQEVSTAKAEERMEESEIRVNQLRASAEDSASKKYEKKNSICDPETEEEITETEYSDETDTESVTESSGREQVETPEPSRCASTNASKYSTPRILPSEADSPQASGRTSRSRTKKQATESSKKADMLVESGRSLKLTDSKAQISKNPEKGVQNANSEIGEDFAQYFSDLSTSTATKQVIHQEKEREFPRSPVESLLPPSVSEPFPSPPRTYEVSPRNSSSKIIYIPSSLEVGCSNRKEGFLQQARRPSSISSSGDRSRRRSVANFRTQSPQEADAKLHISNVKRSRSRWDIIGKGETFIHQQVHEDMKEQLLSRCLTPPPERKPTAMASLMGLDSAGSPDEIESHKARVIRSTLNRLKSTTSEPSEMPSNKPTTSPSRPAHTQPIISLRTSGRSPSKLVGKKKHWSESKRVYKISPPRGAKTGTMSTKGVLSVKSFGQPQQPSTESIN